NITDHIAEVSTAVDEDYCKRIEVLNSLSTFVYSLKTQLSDEVKIDDDEKRTGPDAFKEATAQRREAPGRAKDREPDHEQVVRLEKKLQDVQKIVNPITSKLYADGYSAGPDDDDQEPFRSHDEL
ncbi:hypothetical protein EIP86_008432, partial [Pleurotus ostreatoroseus]